MGVSIQRSLTIMPSHKVRVQGRVSVEIAKSRAICTLPSLFVFWFLVRAVDRTNPLTRKALCVVGSIRKSQIGHYRGVSVIAKRNWHGARGLRMGKPVSYQCTCAHEAPKSQAVSTYEASRYVPNIVRGGDA